MALKSAQQSHVPKAEGKTASRLAKVLNESVLRDILDKDAPVEQIVEDLFRMGHKLFKAVKPRHYESWNDFKGATERGETELVELEGASTIQEDDVVILRGCPMADEMAKLNVDGKAPAFHKDIVNDYMDQNPGSNALLHPGCIAHQVARQLITRGIEIEGIQGLNYYQLACRSMASGKVVYDDNGMKTIGMNKETADRLIDGYACLYVIVKEKSK
jgi:hypothetical protein